jgi:hypothetical protein
VCCIDLAAKVSDCPKKPLEMPLHSDDGDAVIRRVGRRAGPHPREGDFLLVPLLLFVRLPSL